MFEYRQRFIHKYFDLEALKYEFVPQNTANFDQRFDQYDLYAINKNPDNNERASKKYIACSHDTTQYVDFWQEWRPLPQITKGHWYKGLPNYPGVVYKVERLIPRLNTGEGEGDGDERPHPNHIYLQIWGYAPGIHTNTTRIKEYFSCIRSLAYLEENSVPATQADITHALTELANNMGFFNTRLIKDVRGKNKLLNQTYGLRRDACSTHKGGFDFIDGTNQFGYIKYDKVQDELSIVIGDFYPGTYAKQTETSIQIYSASTWGIPLEFKEYSREYAHSKDTISERDLDDTVSEQDLYGVHTHDGYKIKDPNVFLFEPVLSTGALKTRKVKNTRPQDFAYFYSEEKATDYLDRHKAVYSKEQVSALLKHISKDLEVSLNRCRSFDFHKSASQDSLESNLPLKAFMWYMFDLFDLIQDYKQALKSGSGLSAILNLKPRE